jgi:CheY-like chemotaxis protein
MHVLLLTDKRGDHALFTEAMATLHCDHSFTPCESLGEAWSKLTWREVRLPNLIFLDFELSRDYDHELVQILKTTDDLSATPVVVFADSANQEDIGLTYRLQVSCFVVFPKDPELRQRKIQACLEFWSKYAILPELRRWWGET